MIRRLPLLCLLALPLAGLATGCASSGDSDADRIKELQDRVLELQRKAAVADVELARLRQQVAELQARQGSSASAAGPISMSSGSGSPAGQAPSPPAGAAGGGRRAATTAAPGGETAAGRRSPVSPIPPPAAAAPVAPPSRSASAGRVTPQPAPTPPGSSSGMTESDIEVPAGPRARNGSPQLLLPPAAAAGSGATAPPKFEPVTPAVQALYDRGYTLYHQKHYVDAEASFQRFLQAEPNSELANNAQYWIGECRYSRGDTRGALAAFREAVSRYPQGIKTPDALLKSAMCLEALGDRESARATYQDVLRRFPGTAVSAVAEERLAKLP
jgi:tol-pal system protein YbgF